VKLNVACRMKGDTSRGRTIEDVVEIRFTATGDLICKHPDDSNEIVNAGAEVVGLEFTE